MAWQHLQDRHDEPFPGDDIFLTDPETDLQTGRVSRVKSIIAENRSRTTFEVVDSFNQVRIVRRLSGDSWVEIFLEE